MLDLNLQTAEAAAAVRSIWPEIPVWGVVLGSGLAGIAENIHVEAEIDFRRIPHFPRATAMGHRGRFVCGRIGGVPVIVQQGRFHAYEGHSFSKVTLPVRMLHALGVRHLILTNAAGGLRSEMQIGDVMLIDDHINFMFGNPLIGPNDESIGPRFVDLAQPYDPRMILLAEQAGRRLSPRISRGVYAALSGPCYETRAEYRMVRSLGADAVGMSTVPEVLVANHAGMKVLAMSVISNVESGNESAPTDGQEVIQTVAAVEPQVRGIIKSVIENYSSDAAASI